MPLPRQHVLSAARLPHRARARSPGPGVALVFTHLTPIIEGLCRRARVVAGDSSAICEDTK
jgi:hypothetical protein